MTKNKFWAIIEKANWSLDHDYNRISKEWSKELSNEELSQLEKFIDNKQVELYERFKSAWLGDDGNGGFDCGDDGFMDLTAEVIGRGEEFYNNITADKLRIMVKKNDYYESFNYCLLD